MTSPLDDIVCSCCHYPVSLHDLRDLSSDGCPTRPFVAWASHFDKLQSSRFRTLDEAIEACNEAADVYGCDVWVEDIREQIVWRP